MAQYREVTQCPDMLIFIFEFQMQFYVQSTRKGFY